MPDEISSQIMKQSKFFLVQKVSGPPYKIFHKVQKRLESQTFRSPKSKVDAAKHNVSHLCLTKCL